MPGYLDGYVERMAAAAERLHRVSLESRPALELIRSYGRVKSALIYADPPYLGSTRTGGRYRHEMASADEHRELAEALLGCKSAVVISGYPSPLYDEMFAGWWRTDIPHFTGQGGKRTNRLEVLWANRPLGHPRLWDEASA
jgi:DNA adenine methylase